MSSVLRKLKSRIKLVEAALANRATAGNPYERYRDDPEGFARDVLRVRLTPQQIEVAKLLLVPPYRVLVPSANNQGKCVHPDDLLPIASGQMVRAADLVGEPDLQLLTMIDGKTAPVRAYAQWDAEQPMVAVRLKSGEIIRRTANHPVWSTRGIHKNARTPVIHPGGWVECKDLRVGDLVAVPLSREHQGRDVLSTAEVKLAAYMIGDGGMTASNMTFTQMDGPQLDEFRFLASILQTNMAHAGKPYHYRLFAYGNWHRGGSGVRKLMKRIGLAGKHSRDKFIPQEIMGATAAQQRVFLSRLYSTDGWASVGKKADRNIEIGYCSCSERLCRDVQELLSRLGVRSTLARRNTVNAWCVTIRAANDLQKFADDIGIYGKEKAVAAVVAALTDKREKWRATNAPAGCRWEKIAAVESLPAMRSVAVTVPEHSTFVSCIYEHNTFLAAVITIWWHCTRQPAKILTTAPTFDAVQDLLWSEIRSLIGRAGLRVGLLPKACRIERGPNDFVVGTTAQKEGGFKGKHGPNQLFIFDEATDVAGFFWSATETMFQPPGHAWLVIFNPTDPASRVYAEYSSTLRKNGKPTWHVVRLSALEHPNVLNQLAGKDPDIPSAVTLETLERRIPDTCQLVAGRPLATDIQWPPPWAADYLKKTGQTPQWWRPGPEAEATILGRFPSQGAYAVWGDGDWLAACRELPGLKPLAVPLDQVPEIGCDTAAGGNDDTEFHVRCGPCSLAHDRINGHDTMQIVGRLIELAREWAKWFNERLSQHPPAGRPRPIVPQDIPLKIDDAPVGYGVLDRLREQGYTVYGICAAHRALDPERYPNKRSELWFTTAERARRGELDLSRLPDRWLDELGRQAKSCSYKLNSRGQREVTPKDKLKEMLGRSPDSLDAINICYAGNSSDEQPEAFGGMRSILERR